MKKYLNLKINNLKQLILYEFSYLLLISLLIIPTSVYLYDSFIKKQTITPITILFFTIFIIFLITSFIFNRALLTTIINKQIHNKKIKVKEILSISLNKASEFVSKKNLFILLLSLFLIPFIYLTFSGYLMINYLYEYAVKAKFIIVIYFLLVLVLKNYIYSFNYLLVDNKSFKKACKASKNLIKNSFLKDTISILMAQILLIPVLLLIIFINHTYMINTTSSIIINNLITSAVWMTCILLLSISIVSVNVLTNYLFYSHKEENSEKNKLISKSSKHKGVSFIYKMAVANIGLFLLLVTIDTIYQNLNINEKLFTTEITAHRGASLLYPENTMSAFKGAQKENAQWIEIDVRKTKDGQLVVFHDENLARITGVDKELNNLTYQELKKLDYGSFFDKKFAHEQIPLLADVIKYAKKNNLKLNMDLKSSSPEENYEADVVALIDKYDFADSCMIEATRYKQLRNIKRLNPNIKTAILLSTIPNEDLIYLDDIDVVSLDVVNVNSYIVNQIHNAGKEIYVWIVNDENIIKEMVSLNVDNIITDNVPLVIDIIEELKEKYEKLKEEEQ